MREHHGQEYETGKQRKAHFNAPMHQKQRVATAATCQARCSFRRCANGLVRVGDIVMVTRGDQAHGGKRHGGKRNSEALTGAVLRIDSEKDSCTLRVSRSSQVDNKEEAIPVHVSNVVVTQLDESDRLRIAKLTGNRS